MNAVERAAYIEALVDQAPRLTTEQIARLRILLRPATNENGPRTAIRGAATTCPASPTTSLQDTTNDAKASGFRAA
jgi:hypothetical protein